MSCFPYTIVTNNSHDSTRLTKIGIAEMTGIMSFMGAGVAVSGGPWTPNVRNLILPLFLRPAGGQQGKFSIFVTKIVPH
jgi:hypothetical protein